MQGENINGKRAARKYCRETQKEQKHCRGNKMRGMLWGDNNTRENPAEEKGDKLQWENAMVKRKRTSM